MENKLDVAVDELHYALTTGNDENRDHYIKNAIRFIEEVKQEGQKEKEILIKELDRLYAERYKQPSVVAELLELRAYIFTCSYQTAWEQYMEDNEKFNFTLEEILDYLRLKKGIKKK